MNRTIAAAIAAFLLLFSLSMTAYAEPEEWEGSDTPTGMEYEEYTEHTEYEHMENTIVVNPFAPGGTGTVIDFATEDGKLFYTIMATDESVFYLIIDKQRGNENVYFLNAVTVDDLLPLATRPQTPSGTVNTPPSDPTEQPAPDPVPEPTTGGNNAGMLIFIIVLAIIGGGAGWYFKIYRPKQQGAATSDEYEPPADEDEIDLDGWDDNGAELTEDDMLPWEDNDWDEDTPTASEDESEAVDE